MNMDQPTIDEILKSSGCLSFIEAAADRALARIGQLQPEGWKYLTDEARESMRQNFRDRCGLVYGQVLTAEIRTRLQKHDPVGFMLGKFSPEPTQLAVQDLITDAGESMKDFLHGKYPLLNEYQDQISRHYIGCFSDFLGAFYQKKNILSRQLLGGNRITRILHLSTSGADIHRNGRCVIGITTDSGKVYYKPHDCGLDRLYYDIVNRWFSDCTVAPAVVEGDGYAFVSCLEHEAVSDPDGVSRYFYHFGILAALFHGLGSTDMHMENIISCGDKPAAVDMETLLGTALRSDNASEKKETLKRTQAQQDFSDSLMRTCLLPTRMYKGPTLSPLYSCTEEARCLPEERGKYITVEGYEKEFARGFREGYSRMLDHRDEIAALIDTHRQDTVRCILQNTTFYYIVRQMLFRPEYLQNAASREKVYAKLCSPYSAKGIEPEEKTTRYEWECLLKGDIPYYCTTVAGRDLCGEEPGQPVVTNYYQKSVLDSVTHFLARLSGEEETFELNLLRVMFDHAPTDEDPKEETEKIPETPVGDERLAEETSGIFEAVKRDVIRCADGSPIWLSTAEALEVTETFGDSAMIANVGLYSAHIAGAGTGREIRREAGALAEEMGQRLRQSLDRIERLETEKDKWYKVVPTGLYAGLGSVILACSGMEAAGIGNASGLAERYVRFGLDHQMYRYRKIHAAGGAAGLILALSGFRPTKDTGALAGAAAQRILEEQWPDRADLPYGCAGIGAALAAAYDLCGDPRFLDGAAAAFRKVWEDYRPALSGWADGNANPKFMADKGPHEAGIYLAAVFAKEKLRNIPEKDRDNISQLLDRIRSTALDCMLTEKMYRSDSLDQGNALTVLALIKAGQKERAGRILSAMLNRKDRKGCYTVTPPGIRSAFDPSRYMGTPGIGYAMLVYGGMEG